jgi:hypothetical protein
MKTLVTLLLACCFVGAMSSVLAGGTVIYEVKAPDGTVYEVEGPEGASEADLFAAVRKQMREERYAEEDRIRAERRAARQKAQQAEQAQQNERTLVEKIGSSVAGVFRSQTPSECMSENSKKIRFPDASNLLMYACGIGYSPNSSAAARDAGRCITKAETFFALEQSLAIINKCTKDAAVFLFFKNALYAKSESDRSERELEREDLAESRLKDLMDSERQRLESGTFTVFDQASGLYKTCTRAGSRLDCF